MTTLGGMLDRMAALPVFRTGVGRLRAAYAPGLPPVGAVVAELVMPVLEAAVEGRHDGAAVGWVAALLDALATGDDHEARDQFDTAVREAIGRHPRAEAIVPLLGSATCARLRMALPPNERDRMVPFVIDLAPDEGRWLLLVLPYQPGTRYHQQCGGLLNLQRRIEGLGIPCEGSAESQALQRFFVESTFAYDHPARDMADADLDRLDALVRSVGVRGMVDHDLHTLDAGLTLDRDRIDDMVEAWVPVRFADHPGVLLFPNSD